MSETDTLYAKIIAKTWRDSAFKAELIADPGAALKAEGNDVPNGMAVTVLENTDKEFYLVLPPVPTGELSDEALDAVSGGAVRWQGVPAQFLALYAKIIAKTWRDPAFKEELIANPAAALKSEGIDVPAGLTVIVLENTEQQFHLVLPSVPTDELSDEELDSVAGGQSFLEQLEEFKRKNPRD